MWGVLKQNLSYSIRTLWKNKGFTVTAVLTLALGIGATTAIFSVVNAVFEPMPYPKPNQLVMVLVTLVLKEGTTLALVGSLIGLGGAYLVGRAMQSTLYGVGAMDGRAFGTVALVLVAAALVACLLPAWRASKVEPIEALRYD